jgi:hypothetical protein
MANSTEEFWSVDGVSLHQYGWAVTTVGGSRYDLPPRRGSNMPIAYRPGQVHRNKLPDERVITLVMFMVGADPGTGPAIGSSPTVDDERVQWNDNWDFLRRLVYKNYLSTNRVNPTLTNLSTSPDSSVTYKSNMLNGYTVSLNVGRYSATAHPTGRTTPVGNRIAYVTNSGARMWFNLLPGANKIQYTTSSGSGTCVLRFQPPYV